MRAGVKSTGGRRSCYSCAEGCASACGRHGGKSAKEWWCLAVGWIHAHCGAAPNISFRQLSRSEDLGFASGLRLDMAVTCDGEKGANTRFGGQVRGRDHHGDQYAATQPNKEMQSGRSRCRRAPIATPAYSEGCSIFSFIPLRALHQTHHSFPSINNSI